MISSFFPKDDYTALQFAEAPTLTFYLQPDLTRLRLFKGFSNLGKSSTGQQYRSLLAAVMCFCKVLQEDWKCACRGMQQLSNVSERN